MFTFTFNNEHACGFLIARRRWWLCSVNVCWAKQLMLGGVCLMRNNRVLLSFVF